jgi:hypothetical protein
MIIRILLLVASCDLEEAMGLFAASRSRPFRRGAALVQRRVALDGRRLATWFCCAARK